MKLFATTFIIALTIFQFALAKDTNVLYDGKTEFIERDATFSQTPPMFTYRIKCAFYNADWILDKAYDEPIVPLNVPTGSVMIMGNAEATKEEMLALLLKRNKEPKLTCSPQELIELYYAEGEREGIRPDIALSQAFKETGYFKFGGDVLPEQNNYCGLGAVGGGKKGARFETPQLGVRAHIQHILVYASKEPPKTPIVDPRYELVKINRTDIFGNVPNWTGLNGKWAVPGTRYGEDILKIARYARSPDGSSESIAKGESMVKNNPNDYIAYIYRGIAYYNADKLSEAMADFEKSLDIKKTWEGYYAVALTHEKNKNREKAVKDYTRGIELSPNDEELWYNRGLNYFALGKYRKAIEDFTKVLKLHPQATNAAIAKAVSHVKLKEFDEAWADFYKASQINTNDKTVKANRLIIEDIIR